MIGTPLQGCADVREPGKVVLSVECRNLADLDTISKSDPMVVLFKKDEGSTNWVEIGKTEIIYDNLNPKFSKSFEMDYYFERVQPLKFVVLDIDKEDGKLQDQDMIGEVVTTMGGIIGSKGSQFVGKIIHPRRKNNGFIIVTGEEVADLKQDVVFRLSATNLDKKDFFGKSDPFLEISRSTESGWILVHRTEYILKTLNPAWKPFSIPLNKLNGGDMDRPIKISVWDWNRNGKMDYIGEFTTDLKTLLQKKSFPFINEKKKKKNKYIDSGQLIINEITLQKQVTFLDYILGGTQINLVVGIDYTASNGNPKYATSLHYQNPYEPNDYLKAIRSVGEILLAYDSDGKVPVLGFGAKLPPHGQVSHCFHVNNQPNPEVLGVDGILHAYSSSFVNGTIVTLHGPTNFAPIIKFSSEMAKEMKQTEQDVQAYLILLIITDGEITDMEATIAALIDASRLPMSVVIVGVGPADFQKMNILDGDDATLSYGGKTAERDIVQFVPFRDFKKGPPQALAEAVLAEIPQQLLQYMRKNNIQPLPPPSPEELAKFQQEALLRNMSVAPAQIPSSQPPAPVQQPQLQSHPSVYPGYPQHPYQQPYPQQPQYQQPYPQQPFTSQYPQQPLLQQPFPSQYPQQPLLQQPFSNQYPQVHPQQPFPNQYPQPSPQPAPDQPKN